MSPTERIEPTFIFLRPCFTERLAEKHAGEHRAVAPQHPLQAVLRRELLEGEAVDRIGLLAVRDCGA